MHTSTNTPLTPPLPALRTVVQYPARPRRRRVLPVLALLLIASLVAAPQVLREMKHHPGWRRWFHRDTSAPTYAAAPVAARPLPLSAADTVVVDMTTISRTTPPNFFGINASAFWDGATTSAASAQALAQTPIKMVRFAGGAPADWYDWQDPYYKAWSHTSPLDLWRYAKQFGAIPMFQTNYQGHLPNPPGRTYAVNSPENAAAWVSYNAAQKIPAMMEVGNEEDIKVNLVHDPLFQPYIDAFNAQARAMHAAAKAGGTSVQVIGPAGTNLWQWWNRDSLGMFLKQAGNRFGTGQVDGVSIHWYGGASWYQAKGQPQYWLAPGGPWSAIQALVKANDTRPLPVYLSEWNMGAGDSGNTFNATAGHGLVIADMLGALLRSGLAGEQYYQTHGVNGWGLLYGANEGRPLDTATPAYYATALWGQMGDQVRPLTQSDDPASMVSAYAASRAGGAVQVLAVNKLSHPRTLHLSFNGATPAGHRLRVYSLSALHGSISDPDVVYDGRVSPSPQQPLPGPLNGGAITSSTVSYVLPAYSAVVLSIDGTGPAQAAPATATPNPGQPLPTATPQAAPQFGMTGGVSGRSFSPGQTVPLTATVSVDTDMGTVTVDQEVYDATGAKVFQQTHTVDMRAGVPVDVASSFTLARYASGGTYSYKLGVFGPNWTPSYAWNANAASFTVEGPPAAAVSVTGSVSPGSLAVGQTGTFTATVSAAKNGIAGVIVDMEVYSYSGVQLCKPITQNVDVPKDGQRTFTAQCTVGRQMLPGKYVLKVGVFGPNWTPQLAWNGSAATFTVTAASGSPAAAGPVSSPVVTAAAAVPQGTTIPSPPAATSAIAAPFSLKTITAGDGTVVRGKAITFRATITAGVASTGNTISFYIHDRSNGLAWLGKATTTSFAAEVPTTFAATWVVPATVSPGAYTVQAAISAASGGFTYFPAAASFQIS